MSSESTVPITRSNFNFCFVSYGVAVRLGSNDRNLLSEVVKVVSRSLIGQLTLIEADEREFDYELEVCRDDDGNYFRVEFGKKTPGSPSRERCLDILRFLVRIRVAEYARNEVFVHAGVVGWKGKAIVIPASSFSGKTTLVAEFVKLGAVYYSDEYAVFDSEGYVHPFARDLSMRLDGSVYQTDVPVEQLGASAGNERMPVGLILVTKYESDAKWEPELLSTGEGVIEMVPHTISIRRNTDFSLKVLNTAASRAIIARGKRNEANLFAAEILDSFAKDF